MVSLDGPTVYSMVELLNAKLETVQLQDYSTPWPQTLQVN